MAPMTGEGPSFRRRVFVVMPFGKKDVRRKPRKWPNDKEKRCRELTPTPIWLSVFINPTAR